MPAAGAEKIRPIVGGVQVAGTREDKKLNGTSGLVVMQAVNGMQRHCCLTAGHVVGERGAVVGQPDPDIVVGTVLVNAVTQGCDIAVVMISMGVSASPNLVWTGDGTNITAAYTTRRPAKHDRVVFQGAVTGAMNGVVREPHADVRGPCGDELKNVVLVDYESRSAAGDSGAPVLSALQDGAMCYGVHGGTIIVNDEAIGWFTPFENLEQGELTAR